MIRSSRSRDAYNSFGNGSAMRVPAVGHAFNTRQGEPKQRIAEAHYGGVPADIADRALQILDDRLRQVARQFCERYPILQTLR